MSSLIRTVDAVTEPLAVSDVKDYLRIDDNDTSQDTDLALMITAARKAFETYTGLGCITQTWQEAYHFGECDRPGIMGSSNAFDPLWELSARFYLPLTKRRLVDITSITSVKWYDEDDNETTLAANTDYTFDQFQNRVVFKPGVLPVAVRPFNSFVIEYVVGFGDAASDVPADVKLGMKAYISALNSCHGVDPVPPMPDQTKQAWSRYITFASL